MSNPLIKFCFSLIFFSLVLFVPAAKVRADEIIINTRGETVLINRTGKNVLGAASVIHATVSVTPPLDGGGKISVGISDLFKNKTSTELTDLLTLEQSGGPSVTISATESAGLLLIRQGYVRVTTGFKVFIDASTQSLQVEVLGKRIKIMSPMELVRKVIGDKIMNPTLSKIRLELVGNKAGYNIVGLEKLVIFGAIKITLPIKLTVAADVGNIISVERHFISNVLWSVNGFVHRIINIHVVQADLR